MVYSICIHVALTGNNIESYIITLLEYLVLHVHLMMQPIDFIVLFCYSTAGDDGSKELDDDYYNKVTGKNRVKVTDFNDCVVHTLVT